jgi:hypothetical protein
MDLAVCKNEANGGATRLFATKPNSRISEKSGREAKKRRFWRNELCENTRGLRNEANSADLAVL